MPAAAIIGGSLLSAGISAHSASKQAKAVQKGQDAATAESRREFDLVRADTAPIRALGAGATDMLSRLYGFAGPNQITATAPSSAEPFQPMNSRDFDWSRVIGRALGRSPVTIDNATGQPVDQVPARTPGVPDMSVFFASPDYQFRLGETQKGIDRSAAARGGLLSGAAVKEGARYASNLASGEYGAFVDRLMQQAGLGSTGIGASAAAGANAASNITQAAVNGGNARASIYGQNAANINNAVQGGISNLLLQRYLDGGGGGDGGGVYSDNTGYGYGNVWLPGRRNA